MTEQAVATTPLLRFPNVANPPRHSLEEMARLGRVVYERDVKPHIRPEQDGLCLAIDVEGRGWKIGDDEQEVVERLGVRIPDAQISLRRAGRRPDRVRSPRSLQLGCWE